MPLHFYRSPTEDAGQTRSREVLQTQGGYAFPVNKDVAAVTQTDINAATGFVIARNAGAAVASISAALLASGKPILTLDRSYANNFLLADATGGGQASGVSSIYVQAAGVTPLAAGSEGTKTIASATTTLWYVNGALAPGAVVYTRRTFTVLDQYHHLVVPAGAQLFGGSTRSGAVGFAMVLAAADVNSTNALLEQFLWRTAFQVLGDPSVHSAAAATITVTLDSLSRVTTPGRTVALSATATSSNASAVTVAWTGQAGTFSPTTGLSTVWTPPAAAGTYLLTATATSATATTSTATVNATVLPGAQTTLPVGSASTAGVTVTGAATAHEATADNLDTSYVTQTAAGQATALKLTSVSDPMSSSGYAFYVDLVRAGGATSAAATVVLVQSTDTAAAVAGGGGTVIATRTVASVPDRVASTPVTLGAAEADAITNHAALWLRVTTTSVA